MSVGAVYVPLPPRHRAAHRALRALYRVDVNRSKVLTASGNAVLGRKGSASSMTSGEKPTRGRLNAKAQAMVDAWDAQAREAALKKEREAAELLEYGVHCMLWEGEAARY